MDRKTIYRKRSGILVDIQAEIVDYVQYQSGDILGSSTVEYKLRVKRFTHTIDNDDVVLEEWCIFRRFIDFSALHKQLRSQVGEQAVGNNIAQKLRDSISINKQLTQTSSQLPLLPQFNNQGKVPGTSSQKFIQRRISDLQTYLDILLSKYHLLRESVEVMYFLSATDPLQSNTSNGKDFERVDKFGRSEIRKSVSNNSLIKSSKQEQSYEGRIVMNSSCVATGTESFANDMTAMSSMSNSINSSIFTDSKSKGATRNSKNIYK